jgi:hypothetical protein
MEIVPYNEILYWSWAPTKELFLEEMKRSLPEFTPQPIPPQSRGHCEIFVQDGFFTPVIWCSTPDKPWILAHELEHFVHWLLGHKGLKFSDDSEEAYCYLIEHLMEMMITYRRSGRYPEIKKVETPLAAQKSTK